MARRRHTTRASKQALETIPDDTAFCSFSKWHVFNPELEIIDGSHPTHKRVAKPTFGNQCYFISVEAANYFYRENLPIRAAADVIYTFSMPEQYVCRHHFPELIWHGENSVKD